jgi:site-specific DNA-methyltransferase (adenine-specific)
VDCLIYNLDVFDFLELVEDETIDLVVTDPPYNMKKADWDSFKTHQEFLDWTFAWLDKTIPKLKENGSLYIFNTPFNSAYILTYLVQKGLNFQNWITWNKKDGLGGAKRKYSTSQETILFFTKGRKHIFNYDDIRIPYESTQRIKHASKKGILKNGKRWYPNPNGKLCPEVWDFSSQRHKQKVNGKVQKLPHITPKPTDMIERIIKASSNPNCLVMDMFLGSGTTALVAKKLNRKFIGNEKNKNYYEYILQRIQNA